jgi:hypothetical protein
MNTTTETNEKPGTDAERIGPCVTKAHFSMSEPHTANVPFEMTVSRRPLSPLSLIETKGELIAFLLSLGELELVQNWQNSPEYWDELDEDEDDVFGSHVVTDVGELKLTIRGDLTGKEIATINHYGYSVIRVRPRSKFRIEVEMRSTESATAPNPPGREDLAVA